jgi:hypothetical protein
MATDPGYDQPPKKSKTLWYVLGGIAVGVVVLCCLPCGGIGGYFWWDDKQKENKVTSGAGTAISAEDLARTYSDSAHKNQVLSVTGKVNNTGLLGITEFNTAGSTKMLCMPSSTEREKFQNLKSGEQATIKGYCTGKSGDAISLTNCHIVGK